MHAALWSVALLLVPGTAGLGLMAFDAARDTCVVTIEVDNGRICGVQSDGVPDTGACVNYWETPNRTYCEATLEAEHSGGACIKGTWNQTHTQCTVHAGDDVCLGYRYDNRTKQSECTQRIGGVQLDSASIS